ncbi:MAG: flagellar biosynthetic protein FliO [Thermodesulfobacteriota bacterium]
MNTVASEGAGAMAPDLWMTLLNSFAVLCIVLGLVVAVLFFLRRFVLGQGRSGEQGVLKLVATYPVGPKERILLMDVMGERILIGVTPQQINHIKTITNYEL